MAQPVNPVSDSHMHIVKTTAQWNDRAIANWVVPRGCLCIELTTDLKTKLKIGEGNKFYHQLPYVGGDGGDLSNYYTKQEIDTILKNLDYMSIKSINEYPSPEALPKTGNKQGDVRFVRNQTPGEDPYTYLWNGLKWIGVTGIVDIDLSEYAKKSEVNPRLNALEQQAHTHQNKSVVDQLTQTVIDDSHKHANKQVVDQLTQDVIDNSHPHTNKAVLDQVTQPIIDWAHKHDNIAVLDGTTASYTTAEKEKLAALENYNDFVGTDGEVDGIHGLVPAPTVDDEGKFLSADGTWQNVPSGGDSYQAGDGIDIDTETDPSTISVNIGTGLAFDENGALVATGSATTEYVAGDGISIDEGEGSTDITNIVWTQGSINPENGYEDDTTDRVIRSDYLPTGLTVSIGLTATTTDSHDMLYKLAFYDSNHDFISMVDNWKTYADMVNKPMGTSYIRICLESETLGVVDENSVGYAELSYPIEVGKFVITNTGVTHVELDGATIKKIENGETSDIVTFGQDFEVTGGVVGIPDYHSLILYVDQF